MENKKEAINLKLEAERAKANAEARALHKKLAHYTKAQLIAYHFRRLAKAEKHVSAAMGYCVTNDALAKLVEHEEIRISPRNPRVYTIHESKRGAHE